MLAAIDVHGCDRSRLFTVHADETWSRCFVDIFCCRRFDPDVAAAIAVAHFGGTATVSVLER